MEVEIYSKHTWKFLIIEIPHTVMIITQVLLNPINQVPESRMEPVDSEGSTIAIR